MTVGTSAITATDLVKRYAIRRGREVTAVDGVSLDIVRGETFALVGESGCGKTTTAEMLLMLQAPTSGTLQVLGREISARDRSSIGYLRRQMQVVFQSPRNSLDPRMRIREILAEPYQVAGARNVPPAKIAALLEMVRLEPRTAERFPHEVSGGQAQRIAIARALAIEPSVLVLDEPTSALDVSVQAQIINLLMDLQTEKGLTYVFISHDLRVVRHVSDRVAVMYLGRIVEMGTTDRLFRAPEHPYTQALLSAIPPTRPGKRRDRVVLGGDPPNPSNIPSGCRFRSRCPKAKEICRSIEPELVSTSRDYSVACHFAPSIRTA